MHMQMVKVQEQVDYEQNRQLLNRYRFVEYETLRILAGWLPATARLEFKMAMGRFLWEDAQHVQLLYQRLREMQKPVFQRPNDEPLESLMAEAINAPGEWDLLAGIYRVIKPAVVRAYQWHSAQTFANPDAPTLYALRHILVDEGEQVHWAEEALASYPAGDWEMYLAGLLAAGGGISGLEPRTPAPPVPASRVQFVPPRAAARDARFTRDPADTAGSGQEADVELERLQEFEGYSREMLAAETVALVLYLTPEMPWQFTYDASRHCYDETRHCRLGIDWLTLHGLDYTRVPQVTQVFAWRAQYDPALQYCLLTMGNEAHVFPYRHRRLKTYQQSGDRLSAQFISYDMADERNHVSYGHKWLSQLLAKKGIQTPVEEYVEQAVQIWQAEYVSKKLPIHAAPAPADQAG